MVVFGGLNGGITGGLESGDGGGHKKASSLVREPAGGPGGAVLRLAGLVAHGAGLGVLVLWNDEAVAAGVAVEPHLAFVDALLVGYPMERDRRDVSPDSSSTGM